MTRPQRNLERAKTSPQSLKFRELCNLAEAAGFSKRPNSSGHTIYKHDTIKAPGCTQNFQPKPRDKSMANPYQVRQLLKFIDDHNIEI